MSTYTGCVLGDIDSTFCPNLRYDLAQIDPDGQLFAAIAGRVGTFLALNGDENTAGVISKPVPDGLFREAYIYFMQNLYPTEAEFEADAFDPDKERTSAVCTDPDPITLSGRSRISVDYQIYVSHTTSKRELRAQCDSVPFYVAKLVAKLYEKWLLLANYRYQQWVADSYGIFASTGNNSAKVIAPMVVDTNLSSAGTTKVPNPYTLPSIMQDFLELQLATQIHIIGNSDMTLLFNALGIACCNLNGVDVSQLARASNTSFYIDTTIGSNPTPVGTAKTYFAIANHAALPVYWRANANGFEEIRVGEYNLGTMRFPIPGTSRTIDLDFNVKNSICGQKWIFELGTYANLFFPLKEMCVLSPEDPYATKTGIQHYENV